MSDESMESLSDAIAIIGMSGRFPGAADVRQFWQNLCDAKESVSFFSEEELLEAGVAPATLKDPAYVRAAAVLEGSEHFAASFFGFSRKEAELTDPQHRVFLECAWEALEDAGHLPERYAGRIGVYAGGGLNTYMLSNLLHHPGLLESMGVLQMVIGNRNDFIPTKVSYKLNLNGPSVNVNTACSTSLVAVHMACRSLLNYECDMVLAGGVTVDAVQKKGYRYQPGGVLSPDGHCRAFDARAQGTVSGNGAGVVLLKRLEDALSDGDPLYAVIRGSAINNDGAQKIGYTAPSIDGQREVIELAMAMAEVEPDTIGYVEAHGTGTTLGDPIEVDALTRAFRTGTDQRGYCGIGSVKTNIGHLDAAAGVVSLIKAALCLRHRTLVPSLNFEQANAGIDFANTPFYVNTALRPWERGHTPLRAGVSSFGIGGTNAHVVMEEAPERERTVSARSWNLLLLSAQTGSALEAATDRLQQALAEAPERPLVDVAYTLQVGRRAFNHRRMLLCKDTADAVRALAQRDPARMRSHHAEPGDAQATEVVFMFPGMGDQYAQMTAQLYREEPVFRQTVDRCAAHLRPVLGLDLRELLYPKDAPPLREDNAAAAGQTFDLRKMLNRGAESAAAAPADDWTRQTRLVHPALFTVEYALAMLFIELGVRPTALIGHSLGEYVAACVAGVMSLEDALTLVAERAALIQALPEGRMLAVALPSTDLGPMLSDGLSVAALNGPAISVVAGPKALVEEFERHFGRHGVVCLPVQSAHAFHSSMLRPVQTPLRALFERIALKAPSIPYLSNLTGTWITAEQATDPDQWVRHTCETVRFGDGIQALCDGAARTFVEMGPGLTLSSFLQQHPAAQARQDIVALTALPGMHDASADGFTLAQTLGLLWCQGQAIDWAAFHRHETRQRVSLPTYPFERERCWIDGTSAGLDAYAAGWNTDAQAAASQGSGLVYRTTWASESAFASLDAASRSLAAEHSQGGWLIFQGDDDTPADALAQQLESRKLVSVRVKTGPRFERLGPRVYIVRPDSLEDHRQLAVALKETGERPHHLVHLLSLDDTAQANAQAYASVLCIAKAFGAEAAAEAAQPLQLAVVTCGAHAVAGDEALSAEAAALLGPCGVLPLEFPGMRCSNIDVVRPANPQRAKLMAEGILREFTRGLTDVVALRGSLRWIRTHPPASQPGIASGGFSLRQGGVYLLDDYRPSGLSHLLAEHLAGAYTATLVLMVDAALPPREVWLDTLASQAESPVVAVLRGALALEALGARLVVIDATGDRPAALTRLAAQDLRIDGVFHTLAPFELGLVQFMGEARSAALEGQLQRTLGLTRTVEVLEPGFVAVFPSNVGWAGAVGQLDRCAASALLQCTADRLSASGRTLVVSIALDGPDEDAAALPAQALPAAVVEDLRTTRQRYAINKHQLSEALSRALAWGAPSVAVSANPVDEVIRELRTATLPAVVHRAKLAGDSRSRGKRPPYVAPQTEVEQQVAAFWRELLGVAQIGRDDSFFNLGGNSLLAVQFVSRVRETYQIDMPLRSIFQAQTVAEVASLVEKLLLQEIEAMSDDEVVRQIAPAAGGPDSGWMGHDATPYELPNRLVIQQFNTVETDHFYHDIFEAKVYYRNGITLEEGAVVFDVGANVGLFSLFVHRQCAGARIYAFEPAPPVFGALLKNMAAHGVNAKVFNRGVSDRARTETLTFYPNSTGMSSFHADKEEEKEVLLAIMLNQLRDGVPGMTQVMAHADDILEERFKALSCECELTTVSDVIRAEGVAKIDLLKIDVQKSEFEVMEGIETAHWALIRQLVVEVHDIDGRVARACSLLESRGYRVIVEQELLYRTSNISNVYAIRP